MLGDVLAQPLQLGDALWRAQSAGIRPRDSPAGSWSAAWAARRSAATSPRRRSATAPPGRSRSCAATRSSRGRRPRRSCSARATPGETEETLACFEAAGAAGAQRVVLTTGGTLAELARAEGVPVIGVPAGHAAARGRALHDGRRARVRGAVRRGARRCTPRSTRPRRCSSGSSRSGGRTRPTTRCRSGSRASCTGTRAGDPRRGATVAVARRWHTQINENAEAPAFWTELPEANHNEICGWERGRELAPLPAVFLERPRPAPARGAPHRADGRGGRARGRAGDAGRRRAARAASSACCRRCCSATW